MKYTILCMILTSSLLAETIWFNNGKRLEGKILEANNTHVLFARDSDLQQFRFKVDVLTLDSKKLVELYHNTNRYGEIPRIALPVNSNVLKIYTARIDQLIQDRLRGMKRRSMPRADENTFIRRLYLTVLGRIPTLQETQAYLSDRDSDKKDKTIVRLLNHPGHVSHQLNWLSDLLRVKDRIDGVNIPNILSLYREYLREQLTINVPYDKLVRSLINNSGDYFGGNPAAGYYLRDRGMQEDNLAHTVQIFLGTRLECAMCHDHPFDRWTQRDFYEMTAFTSGIGRVVTGNRGRVIGELSRMINRDGTANAGKYQNWRNIVRDAIQFGVDTNGTGKLKLPNTFIEDNGKPGDVIQARAMFTPNLEIGSKDREPESLKRLAEWLTDPNNPRFTTVITNRMWKQIFGVGLVEPLDNFMDDTFPVNEDLLWFVERIMVSVNYDLREFQRVLLNTELFARESKKQDYESLETYDFSGPLLRRMTGEQLWDSLVTLVYTDIDKPSRVWISTADRYRSIYEKYKDWNASSIFQDFQRIATEFPDQRRLEDSFKYDNGTKKPANSQLVRSSYLVSPAPGGHLIRQFGGSDRLSIENSNSEPNTTQVLNLLNGFVETNIIRNNKADFIKSMQAEKNNVKQIENVFMSVLSRKPNPAELRELKGLLDEPSGYKHITWILLNTHEFMFIQ